MFEHWRAVIAIGAGVGEHVQLHGAQRAIALGADLDVNAHGMARGGGDELFLAGEFELDRLAGVQGGERDDVLDQHFLLGAKTAADAFAEHAQLGEVEIEYTCELLAGEERHLRAGAYVEPAGGVGPADGGQRFEMGMLHARHKVSALMHGVGLREANFDIANAAVHFPHDIVLRIENARFLRVLVVDHRRARRHGLFRIEHRRQGFVIDLDLAAGFLGGGFALGHHGGDPLADEAHDRIQHHGVVGIDQADFMARSRKRGFGRVLMREHRDDAWDAQRRAFVDGTDARMRMRRAQQFDVQQALRREIHGEARFAGHHVGAGRSGDVMADAFAGFGDFYFVLAGDGVLDGTIAGAAADIAFQAPGRDRRAATD